MDVSQENPVKINPSDGENPESGAQLDKLLDLLVDLKIIEETETPSLDENLSEDQASEEREDWQNIFQVPRLLALPPAKEPPTDDQPADNLVTRIEAEEIQPQSFQMSEDQALDLLSLLFSASQDSGVKENLETPVEVSESSSETNQKLEEKKDVDDPFSRLQNILVGSEMSQVRDLVAYVDEKVANLEHQIYEPSELMNLILPWMAELLSRKVADSKEEVVDAIAPIIDRVIENRTEQDRVAMSSALAPLISAAITQQIKTSPEDVAQAIAPTMGKAIKEQIALERDAMVDALYPVIGSTISKYLAEAIRAINEKVADAFSVEGVTRKLRAKIQGVSEAELILQEALPFTVQAIFLIHKGSGLVISDIQQAGDHRLESDMVAGMLTAIRSFVNDCIAQSGESSELDAIDYGTSKINLEVAGYCYLALVTQGQPSKKFIQKMRLILSTIVVKYGKPIELFDGDPEKIPSQVNSLLEGLVVNTSKQQAKKPPIALLSLSLAIVGIILVPWGIYSYRSTSDRQIAAKTTQALLSTPELAVYRLNVETSGEILRLSGKLPNQYLRQKAEKIARSEAPNFVLDNKITTVEVPADPILATAEVKRVTSILNQIPGVAISTRYNAGKVTVMGTVRSAADTQQIVQALKQIPGVQSVSNNVKTQIIKLDTRIYFEKGSAQLTSVDNNDKINQVKAFLNQYPEANLKIVGYSDPSGTLPENQRLSLERARSVWSVLVSQGVDSRRLQITGTTKPPLGVDPNQTPELSRVVGFEPITLIKGVPTKN
jgi:outer membrane protein OmpA-like peptidoglycan-associated protein